MKNDSQAHGWGGGGVTNKKGGARGGGGLLGFFWAGGAGGGGGELNHRKVMAHGCSELYGFCCARVEDEDFQSHWPDGRKGVI